MSTFGEVPAKLYGPWAERYSTDLANSVSAILTELRSSVRMNCMQVRAVCYSIHPLLFVNYGLQFNMCNYLHHKGYVIGAACPSVCHSVSRITEKVSKSGYLCPAPESWKCLNGAGRSRTGTSSVPSWRRSPTGPVTVVMIRFHWNLMLWLGLPIGRTY